ncbi:hypothetical protein KAJ27_04615 [bacterium]|nr:hypothetical protein [bacterium]
MSSGVNNTRIIIPKIRRVGLKTEKIVREKNNKRNYFVLSFLVTIILLTAFVVLHVYQYVRLSDVKAEITKVKISRYSLKKKMNDIDIELVKLKNIKRIKSIAESRGMKQPDVIKFIDSEK